MKKLVSIVLLLALCLATLSGCTLGEKLNKLNPFKKGPSEELLNAADYLFLLYKDDEKNTPSDYDVVAQIMVDGVIYTVEWTVDVPGITIKESEKAGFYTIDLDEKTPVDIPYVLTATIKDAKGKYPVTKTFERVVPTYKLLSYEQYMAAQTGDAVVIEGIVAAIHSKSEGNKYDQLYLHDAANKGGYYVYSMGKDPIKDLGLKLGMTVEVTGTKDIYSGLHEVKDASVKIVDATAKTLEPLDITETFKNASGMTDANLVNKLGMLVTIKGVEITDQDLATSSQYYKFKLGENESYIRIYDTDLPASVSDADKAALIKTHTEHRGYSATVTGVVIVYSGSVYLNPVSVDAFSELKEIQRTDEEKLALELDALKVQTAVTEDTVITLPLTGSIYNTITFAWAINENACATYDATTGKLTVTLPEEATTLTLTLTATLNGIPKTETFKIEVDAKTTDYYVPQAVETPKVNTAFKLHLYQTKLGKDLYFAGDTTDKAWYLATTDNAAKAADVYLEAVDGVDNAYRMYFYKGADKVKTYIELYERSAGSGSIQLVTETPATYYTYDADLGLLIVKSADGTNSYYMGTYGTYNTISASNTSYITGNKAGDVGVSQFPAKLVTLAAALPAPEKVTAPVANEAFKLHLYQTKLGKDLYFAGDTTDKAWYLATTDKVEKAADVYLEAVDGVDNAFRMFFYKGADKVKTYIELYERSAGSGSIQLVTETPATYYTYDADLGLLIVKSADGTNSYYMGTYGTYNTISASNTSYITGNKAGDVGVSQFPASLVKIVLKKAEAKVAAPETDKAFKLNLYQTKLGQSLYFAGDTTDKAWYLATTDKISKAADVYLEAVDGVDNAYRMFFYKGVDKVKTYIEVYERSAGSGSIQLVTETPATYYVYNADLGMLIVTSADGANSYYMGTYGTYNTISASNTSYITGDKAGDIGKSQFPAYIVTVGVAE